MMAHTIEESEANIGRMIVIHEQVVATSMGIEPLAHRIRDIESKYEALLKPSERDRNGG